MTSPVPLRRPPATVLRLAAPAPTPDDDSPEPPLSDEQRDLDNLCERWAAWRATRRFYGPPSAMLSVLGQLSGSRSRPLVAGGPNAIASAQLSAFNLAYTCQPDSIDKRVFALYYVHRVAPIKRAAAALGISRPHFYRVLGDFRVRVAQAAKSIEADNLAAGKALPHAPLTDSSADVNA